MLQHWTKTPATSDLTQLTQDIAELKQLIQTGVTAVKSIQRGVTTQATTITIDAVDMTKAVVLSTSKASNGKVSFSSSLSSSGYITENGCKIGASYNSNGAYRQTDAMVYFQTKTTTTTAPDAQAQYPATVSQSGNISSSGDHPNVTTKQYSARLTSETTLECDGAVEWQVIEYN